LTSRFCHTGWKDQELQQEPGADLRGHYDKLRLDSGVNTDEASQLLEQMETYNRLTGSSTGFQELEDSLQSIKICRGLHGGFDSWLGGCEAKLAEPMQTQRNPVGTRKQLEELKLSHLRLLPTSPNPGRH